MYVPVPPDGTASRLTRVPVVPVVGAVIDTDRGGGGDVSVIVASACGIRSMIPAQERTSRIEAMTGAGHWLVRKVLTILTTPFLWLDAYTRYANINCNYY